MNLKQSIRAFEQLGEFINGYLNGEESSEYKNFRIAIENATQQNSWFTLHNIENALSAIVCNLQKENLGQWVAGYRERLSKKRQPRTVGVIMAGNIPLVGFHDFLSVLVSGHRFNGKASTKDPLLLPAVAKVLLNIEPGFSDMIDLEEEFKQYEAIIATGSNNSARYFHHYFGKYPNIIRKSRNSVAILNGNESKEELRDLGKDIFMYFGLGCRSVSKIMVPKGYDFDQLFAALYDYKSVIDHNSYANNYNYNRTIYLMNKDDIFDNGFLLVKKDQSLASPMACLHYEYHDRNIDQRLMDDAGDIQCIMSSEHVPFGKSQLPELWDYADGEDTMEFLLGLD